jgi:iron(III) transport system ATP-binding protein
MFVIENLHKTFVAPGQADVRAVDGISLNVETGKLLTLLGPSGCGKTTTLRCLAGLERPDAGRIIVDNKVVFDSEQGIFIPPSERALGMVFQSYAIWPHMTVFENVAFPLRVARDRKYTSAEIKQEVGRVLEMVRLNGYENRGSTQLSGGQQQRLAFARGLVRKPN